MVDFCASLAKRDPLAYALCNQGKQRGDTLKKFDQGSTRLKFTGVAPAQKVWAKAHDQKLAPSEIYLHYFRHIEGAQARALNKKNTAKSGMLANPYGKLFSKEAGYSLPWIIQDPKLWKKVQSWLPKAKAELKQDQLSKDPVAYRKKLALALYDFITRDKIKNGLGVAYSTSTPHRGYSLGEIYQKGEATCLEFVRLYLALGQAAGLSPLPIEVFRNAQGKLIEHVRIAIPLDEGNPPQMLHLDISEGGRVKADQDTWVEMTRLDLIAYYWNTYALYSSQLKTEDFYREALRFDPYQYMVLNNYAFYRFNHKRDAKGALDLFRKAIKTHSQYPFIYLGLAQVYDDLGNDKMARRAKRRAKQLFLARP